MSELSCADDDHPLKPVESSTSNSNLECTGGIQYTYINICNFRFFLIVLNMLKISQMPRFKISEHYDCIF